MPPRGLSPLPDPPPQGGREKAPFMTYQNPPTTPRKSATFDDYTLSEIRRAAITGIYKPSEDAFGYYCIGLLIGFFVYLMAAIAIAKKEGNQTIGDWLGSEPVTTKTPRDDSGPPPPPPVR